MSYAESFRWVHSRSTAPRVCLLLCSLSLIIAFRSETFAQKTNASSYYLIGNSLTWDTVPQRLEGDVQWHVDCGVSLPYIYANPNKPCVKESTIWPTALSGKQYKFLCVQPHYGATLAQDVETISAWLKLQPTAVLVIHSGWAFHTQRADEFASYSSPQEMEHSPIYMRALISELQRLHPRREIRQTYAQNLLAQIAEDIATGNAPIPEMQTLYRDSIHMTLDHGRYLMHNAMRHAFGQPLSSEGFEKLNPEWKSYLNGVLEILNPTEADKRLLLEILSNNESLDRAGLIEQLTNSDLKQRATALLPTIAQALITRESSLKLAAEIEEIGGRVVWSPKGPQWLYLTTGDVGTEIFDVITTVDFYNGNNPLKGRGGRNEHVTDQWLERLSNLSTLQRLDLANCAIKGHGLRHIADLTQLRELNLTLTPVTDAALEHCSGLVELRTLGLASTQCTGTGFAYLKSLKKLESVNFHYTPLNDAGLQAISQVPISDRLWFAHTHFTNVGAKSLASLTELKRCGIGSKDPASSGEAVAALEKLPLEDLSLLDNQATPEGIAHATKIFTLKRLDVSYAPQVTDESMLLISQLPKLEEFRVGNAQITDEGLLHLAQSKSLRKVELSGLKQITPAGVEVLKRTRPKLIVNVR